MLYFSSIPCLPVLSTPLSDVCCVCMNRLIEFHWYLWLVTIKGYYYYYYRSLYYRGHSLAKNKILWSFAVLHLRSISVFFLSIQWMSVVTSGGRSTQIKYLSKSTDTYYKILNRFIEKYQIVHESFNASESTLHFKHRRETWNVLFIQQIKTSGRPIICLADYRRRY